MDEVKLLPCPLCETEMRLHQHCFSHPRPAKGDCILRHYSFDNIHAASWNTRPTLVTDEVVERVRNFIYDATKDEFEHGWTLSEHQTRDLIALAAMPAIDQDGGDV